MAPKLWLAALGLAITCGCRSSGTSSSGSGSVSSAVPSAAKLVPSSVASAAPLRLGPASAETKDERERALLGFFESGQAAKLEVVATEPGSALDERLRESLLNHVVDSERPIARGNAQVGAATVTGGEVPNVQRVVAGMRAGFRNCYQRALVDASDYVARLEVRLTLDAEGAVKVAKVSSPQRNAALFACVEARAAAAQFAPPSGGKPTTVAFSVTLSKP